MVVRGSIIVETEIKIIPIQCGGCGVWFGMESGYHSQKKHDGRGWTCPNGCNRVFRDSDVDRVKAELEQARQATARARESEAWARSEAERERRSHAATKGKLTKTLKRVEAGVCVHCNRTFQQLARHMKSKHPEHGDA